MLNTFPDWATCERYQTANVMNTIAVTAQQTLHIGHGRARLHTSEMKRPVEHANLSRREVTGTARIALAVTVCIKLDCSFLHCHR